MMTHSGYLQFAEALVFAQGSKAEAEAAKHAILCEKSGDMETAETWRNVQFALWSQPVAATHWLNLSDGVSNCNVFLGRLFN